MFRVLVPILRYLGVNGCSIEATPVLFTVKQKTKLSSKHYAVVSVVNVLILVEFFFFHFLNGI